MNVYVGTSGYSYDAWKGSFYPEELPAARRLEYYAGRFRTVEIDSTFYRMPARATVERWAAETPAGFTFAVKAHRKITHMGRLKPETADSVKYLDGLLAALGDKLGPVLYQLPPNLKKDAARLRAFLELLPRERRAAFEFRHDSWFDDEVYDALRARGAALCLAEDDERAAPAAPATATWGYLRLRRAEYDDGAIGAWSERIRGQPWSTAWAFFKHEDEGRGPRFAAALTARLSPRDATPAAPARP